jgi:hypothetical protein
MAVECRVPAWFALCGTLECYSLTPRTSCQWTEAHEKISVDYENEK